MFKVKKVRPSDILPDHMYIVKDDITDATITIDIPGAGRGELGMVKHIADIMCKEMNRVNSLVDSFIAKEDRAKKNKLTN